MEDSLFVGNVCSYYANSAGEWQYDTVDGSKICHSTG